MGRRWSPFHSPQPDTSRSTRAQVLEKNLQTSNSDKNWQTSCPNVCHTVTGQI